MDRLGAGQFLKLQQLEQVEPFGERGAWLRHAVLCALLVNINRGKDQSPVEIDDFMPESLRSKPSAPSTPRDTSSGVLAFFEMAKAAQETNNVAG